MKAYLLRERSHGIMVWESPYDVVETARRVLDKKMGICPDVKKFSSKSDAINSTIGNVLFEYREEDDQWLLRVGDYMIDMVFMVKQ